jgi:hypothetical protein
MNIVNCTPHDIHIFHSAGNRTTIPSSGTVARCSPIPTKTDSINGIDTFVTRLGPVRDLPDSQPDTIYIVSLAVREKESHREDLYSPFDLVRDDKGNVIGCNGLTR